MVDRDGALAAELVLGLLEPAERAAALRRQLAEPAFAALVEEWRARIAPLHGGFADAEAPADGWARISEALDLLEDEGAPQRATPVPATGSTRRWQWATAAASAVAAVLALALVLPDSGVEPIQPDTPAYAVAQLTGPIEGLLLSARYDETSGKLLIKVEGMPETETEPVLWLLEGDGPPVSLGYIDRTGVTSIIIPDRYRAAIQQKAQLLITMEPAFETAPETPGSDPVAAGTLTEV